MTEASSSADPGSGSAEAVAAAPSVSSAVDTHKLPASQDTCSWYGGKSCSEPRTCHDCLNVAVSGSECAVGPRGECVTKTEYEQYVRTHSSSLYDAPVATYYLSANASYCSASDTTCQACKTWWLEDYSTGRSLYSAPSCTGQNDCICLATCELPNWHAIVTESRCTAGSLWDGTTPSSTKDFLIAAGSCVAMTAMVAGFALISMCLGKLVRKMDGGAEAVRRTQFRLPVRVPTGPQLSLVGWTSMREKLMQTEKQEEDHEGEGGGRAASALAPIVVATEPESAGSSSSGGSEQPHLWIRW